LFIKNSTVPHIRYGALHIIILTESIILPKPDIMLPAVVAVLDTLYSIYRRKEKTMNSNNKALLEVHKDLVLYVKIL